MRKYYLLILSLVFSVSCSSDILEDNNTTLTKGPTGPDSAFDDYRDGQVVLGKDLSNIYSVEAMRGAYNQKYPNGDGQYGPSGIRTTHYYVRFLPKNEGEYDSIVHYDLSEIPLFSEVTKGGSSYHDPSIPADQYTWQYALIPVNKFEPTNVQYEILRNMFIVGNGSAGVPGPGGAPSYSFWEALEILNHKVETGEDIGPGISWTPSGKIEVYDDLLQKYIPLVGLKVIINKNGIEESVTTDATGSFRSKQTYKTFVSYKIKWASGIDFEIKDGDYSQAYLFSKKTYLPFNVKLNDVNMRQKNIATIYRAASRAYYKDYLNMDRPLVSNFYIGGAKRVPLRIAYSKEETVNNFAGIYKLNAGSLGTTKPNVIITSTNFTSDWVFRVTTHELAHVAHHIKFKRYYWSEPNQIIHESWADAVEYYITKLEYSEYGKDIDSYAYVFNGPVTYGNIGYKGNVIPSDVNKQKWPIGCSRAYSSLVVDLVDNENQALYHKVKPMANYGYKMFPNDDVSGFELSKIQTALGATSLSNFKDKVKSLNSQYYASKNTLVQIDTLFNRFEYYWERRN